MNKLNTDFFFDIELISHKKLFEGHEYIWDVLSTLPSYLQSLPLGKIEGEVSPQAHLMNKKSIYIGKGTVVEPGAFIQGPCYIGENCQIRHGAYIRGNVLVDNESVIGHASEVKGSILLFKAHAAHFAYVGDSILGNHTNLGAGFKCANLRLDGKEIFVRQGSDSVGTGRRKLGLIAGDNSSLGCNGVSNPGTFLGRNTLSYPCTSMHGFVEANQVIKK